MADRWGINEEQYKKVQYFAQGRSIQLVLLELDGTISVKIDNVWYDIENPKFKHNNYYKPFYEWKRDT